MNIRNEIKAQIIRAGMTMQEVVDLLSDEYGWSDSVSNLSAKLQGKYTIQGSIGACRCAWLRHRMAEKDGEVIPGNSPPHLRPHRRTACCPWTGSERYVFAAIVCKKCSAEQLHADGLTKVRGADICLGQRGPQ